MTSTRGPVAILSHVVPPSSGGQATVLTRLFGSTSSPDWQFYRFERNCPTWLGHRAILRTIPWKLRRIGPLQEWCFRSMLDHRSRVFADELSGKGCRAVIGCTGGDLLDIPTAVMAAHRASVPAYCYYFDDYRLQWQGRGLVWRGRARDRLVKRVECEALEGAVGVIVPNELLADDLSQRTRTPVHVIHNPVDLDLYAQVRQEEADRLCAGRAERTIVYTGAVYEAQADAVRNCAIAIDTLRRHGQQVRMHVYTRESERRRHRYGIPHSVAWHAAVSELEVARVQCKADVLLLALGFQTGYPELIRTSSPLKYGEYLASGRPMLVHAPEDSFVTKFAAEHECGVVCPRQDPAFIAEAISRLLVDCDAAACVVRSALASSRLFAVEPNRGLIRGALDPAQKRPVTPAP